MIEHRRGYYAPTQANAKSVAPCTTTDETFSRPGCAKPRVLLVDDDELTARVLKRALEAEQFECRAAYDYRTALRTAGEWLPDFLICDIDLQSRRDGCDVLKTMRSAHQTIQGISISGLPLPDARQRSESGGFQWHLAKPVGVDELVHKLRTLAISPRKAPRRTS